MSDPVGVLFGGPSSEHDVSVITGLQAAHCLADAGREVVAIYWSKAGDLHQVDATIESAGLAEGPPTDAAALELRLGAQPGLYRRGRLRSTHVPLEAVVLACHGGAGEDGTLQGALDLAGIPYTGPSRQAALLSMDKLAFGTLVEHAGLPTLPRAGYLGTVDEAPGFPAPWIAKPRYGGSSIGTEVVEDLESLRQLVAHSVHMGHGCVVEPYLPGSADINIAVRSHPKPQVSAIERPTRGGADAKVLGFKDKYTAGEGMVGAARELPAVLDDDVADTVRSSALRIAALLPVRGVSRVDYLLTDDAVYVNELNAIPGSLAKYLWLDDGPTFTQQLLDMVEEATLVRTYRPITAGADGQLLRDAGSIAAKLA